MRARTPIIVSVMVLAIGLAGCGGGDGTPSSTTPQTTRPPKTTAATVTTTTISAPSAASYTAPRDLGALPGSSMSAASDINNDGVVVGIGYLPARPNGPPPVAVWWPTPTGGPQRLDRGLQGADNGSRALRINDRGQILVSTSSHAFVIDPTTGSSTEVVVPFASAPLQLFEAGMNNHGDVVGSVIVRTIHDAEGQHAVNHAFRWTYATRKAIDLGTLARAESSRATAINDAGQIVGESGGRPFFWNPESRMMRELDSREGVAFNVNDHGRAVGGVAGARAIVWDLDTGAASDLTVHAQGGAGAIDINDFGQVLGGSGMPSLGPSWVWNPTTHETIEVARLPDAFAVNEHAQVAGIANAHAALWNPVTR